MGREQIMNDQIMEQLITPRGTRTSVSPSRENDQGIVRNVSNRPNVCGPRRWPCDVFSSWCFVCALTLCVIPQVKAADSPSTPAPPAFKKLRYDESYEYLRDPSRRADYLDAIKFIPFNTNGDWYLTLGGEIRERYEYYHNNLWGRGPQDQDGYLLQRFMGHADAHFGEYFRFFSQFKSGLEDDRNGGPRPTDRGS